MSSAVGARRRVVVVVTEGATPHLLNRWCDRGELPSFARLRAHGAGGPLDAEAVPYEPPGLVSLLTGARAADHGFLSYWGVHDPDYRPQVLTSGQRRQPLLWQQPEAAGLRFACVGLFGTHPVEPFDGWLISYPMQTTLRGCHPATLQRELAARGIRPVHDVSIWWSGQARAELLPQLLDADERRGRAALALFDEGADAVIVNLTAIDRSSHIFWQELELGDEEERGSAVLAAYRTADRIIGWFLDRLDGDTTLLAFSEIGFGPLRAYCSVNEALEQAGLLAHGPDGVDWGRSQAFESVQGTHGVNINLVGRYKSGTVAGGDYTRVRDETTAALLAAINPRTGLPLFDAVRPREEVYPGTAVEAAPDLILEPADWRYLPLGDPSWAGHVKRTWQSAWHRPRSYWAALGAGVRDSVQTRDASGPADMTAAVFAALDRDIPAWCAGTPPGQLVS